MRTITINGVSFDWKFTTRAAKIIGVAGPGDDEGMPAAMQRFGQKWETAQAFILAGCAEKDREKLQGQFEDWSFDDYVSFLQQAMPGPNQQTASADQPQESRSGSPGMEHSPSPDTTLA